MSRTRRRHHPKSYGYGFRYYNSLKYERSWELEKSEVCTDHVSKPPYVNPQDFHLRKFKSFVPTVTGDLDYGPAHKYEYWNYPALGISQDFGLSSLTSDAAYLTEALARENPSTPDVDLLVMLAELREMPRMIRQIRDLFNVRLRALSRTFRRTRYNNERKYWAKQAVSGGDDVVKSASSDYLAYHFGIAPLIRDIQSIMNLQRSIADRIARAKRLEKGDSVGGTLEDINETSVKRAYVTFTVADQIRIKYSREYRRKVWYTFHQTNGDSAVLNAGPLARKVSAVGFNQPLASLWNAIPWSFLIDYFLNIDSFLRATQGAYKIRPDYICLMKQTEVKFKALSIEGAPVGASNVDRNHHGLTLGNSRGYTIWKDRTIHFDPQASIKALPWVSPRQRLNIAALLGSRRYR